MIRAYLLTTGNDGHSHVQTGYLTDAVSYDANAISFKETAPNSFLDWHTAPTNQYVICLTGTLNFETQTGEKFKLSPGEVLIAMDTTGTGHVWQMQGHEPWRRVYVPFDQAKGFNFKADE